MGHIRLDLQAGMGESRLVRRCVLLVAILLALALLTLRFPLEEVHLPLGYYLPLHTLLEFVAILAAALVFTTVWHMPAREVSASLLLIAAALFAAGWLDFAHALSFKGMPDLVTPSSVQKGIAFWLAARLVVASALLGVSFLPQLAPPSRRMRAAILVGYTLLVLAVLWGVLFHEDALPATYIDGSGLTPFKIGMEWVIVALLLVAAWRYFQMFRQSNDEFFPLIFAAAAISALSELFLTRYQAVSDLQNLLGHLYKIISYGLIYQAMFVVSVRKPYQRLAAQAQTLQTINDTLRTQSLALESVATPALVTDLQGKVKWRNRASRTIWSNAFDSRLFLFAAPMTPDPQVAHDTRATVQAGQVWRGLVHTHNEQAQDIVLDRTVTPLRNEAGVIEGYVIVSEDVTARLQAQSRHQRVLETTLDGFWITDIEGHLLEANEAYARMSGYSIPELLTLRISQLEASQTPEQVSAHARYLIQHGHDQFETRHRHKLGHDFPVEVSVTCDPESRQLYVFTRDRSEREHAAAIKQDLERQLQQSQRLQELGQLTGGIAHDFNNILAAILGYTNLALSRFVPDKQGKLAAYLREVVAASERARDLIAKLLSFTRMRANTDVGLISPATVIDEVVAMMRPSIAASIELRSQIDDALPIRMDPVELNQVLVNLIINARDAINGQGHGLIQIHLHRVSISEQLCSASQQRLAGDYLALDVSDSGSGIAPEHLPRLFTPFFTTKDVGKGTGLGLSMVQGILRRAGAYIVVESAPGQGSRFRVLFPLMPALQAAATAPSAGEAASAAGAGQCIWVLDDEAALTLYLGDLLEGQGYRVRQFNDPAELLRAFEAAPAEPDLLITDQAMPGLSGTALAARLLRTRPELPIILCTGYDADVNRAELRRQGIRRCFLKPVSAVTLLQAVTEELPPGR